MRPRRKSEVKGRLGLDHPKPSLKRGARRKEEKCSTKMKRVQKLEAVISSDARVHVWEEKTTIH